MPATYDMTRYEDWADKIVQAVTDYWTAYGYAPSVKDLCEEVGMKTSSRMQRYVDRLCAEGRLVKSKDVPRSLRLPSQIIVCPSCGERVVV